MVSEADEGAEFCGHMAVNVSFPFLVLLQRRILCMACYAPCSNDRYSYIHYNYSEIMSGNGYVVDINLLFTATHFLVLRHPLT